jgi:hypothetical protein
MRYPYSHPFCTRPSPDSLRRCRQPDPAFLLLRRHTTTVTHDLDPNLDTDSPIPSLLPSVWFRPPRCSIQVASLPSGPGRSLLFKSPLSRAESPISNLPTSSSVDAFDKLVSPVPLISSNGGTSRQFDITPQERLRGGPPMRPDPARPPPGPHRLFARGASIDHHLPVLLMSRDLTNDHLGQLEVRAQRARILALGHPLPELIADLKRLRLGYSPFTRIHPSIPYIPIDRALSLPVEAPFPSSTTEWPP